MLNPNVMRMLCYFTFTIFSIIFMASPKNNGLVNTSWSGIMNVPNPTPTTLKFSIDTFYVYVDKDLIETSTYSVSNDTLTLKKVSGGSPCMDEVGIYAYDITEDVLIIKPVSDSCDARYYALSPLGYKKIEE
ncbi:MAG: hypothetical protein ABIO60_08120 [Aquaticitalea sp.]